MDNFRIHRHTCKLCEKVDAKIWRIENREHAKEYSRKYNPLYYQRNKTRIKKYASQWKKDNKDKVGKMTRAYRIRYPEKAKAVARKWKQANKDRVNASTIKRQNLIKGASSGILILRADIYERDNGICHICNQFVDIDNYEIDHIKPVSKGGSHTLDNVATSHPRCNRVKSDRWPYDKDAIIL